MQETDNIEEAYLDHLVNLIEQGEMRSDRTGTGTRSIFGHQMHHDLRIGFPLFTTKRTYWKGVVSELLWFLKGDTNLKYLHDHNNHIWDEWATPEGELGPIYGAQWRDFNGVDQIKELVRNLKADPYSRRHLVSAWNPTVLPRSGQSPNRNAANGRQALPPCHTFFQVNISGSYMDLQMYQRSADWFLGVPFNVASYSLLLMMLAKEVNCTPRYFIHTFGDTHLYNNHIEQANELLQRIPKSLPEVLLPPHKTLFDYDVEDIELFGYDSHPAIKAPVAV